MEKNEYEITFEATDNGERFTHNMILASDIHDLDYIKYYAYKAFVDEQSLSMVYWKIISIINMTGQEIL